jgi:uncharacterized membrane protein YbhN (UPF0104 family)
LAAVAVFLVAFVPAVARYRHLHLHADPVLLLLVLLVAPPLVVAINAAEYSVVARVAGHRVKVREAVAVSIGGTIANLLPIPGSVVIRSTAIVSAGRGLRGTLQAVATVGGVWIGVTATAFGAAAAFNHAAVGAALLVSGLSITVACLALLRRQVDDPGDARRLMIAAVAIEATTVVIDSVRLAIVLHAIGVNAGALDALALTAASVVTVAAGIFPAGLGLREALSAAFGAASGMSAAVSVTAAVVDRVVVMTGLALVGAILAIWARRSPGQDPAASSGASEVEPR